MDITHFTKKDDDRFFRFSEPLSHFKAYSKKMEEYLFNESLRANKIQDREDELMEDERRYEEDEDSLDSQMRVLSVSTSKAFRFTLVFPNMLRSSLLISVYAFFEKQLDNLCKDIQNKKGFSVKFNSIKGSGIDRAKIYLSEVAKINFPSDSIEWKKIKHYRDIRNVFVHNGGLVTGSEDRMANAISQLESIVLEEGDFFNGFQKQISLDNDFIDKLIQVLKSFWSKLEAEYLDILYII